MTDPVVSGGRKSLLLTVGITLRKPTKDYMLKGEHLSLKTPDGKTLRLASKEDCAAANLMGLSTEASAIANANNPRG